MNQSVSQASPAKPEESEESKEVGEVAPEQVKQSDLDEVNGGSIYIPPYITLPYIDPI